MDHASNFDNIVKQSEELHREALRTFTRWVQQNWRHDTKEQWKHAEPWPGDDVEKGYNLAVDSLDMAMDVFLDEIGY